MSLSGPSISFLQRKAEAHGGFLDRPRGYAGTWPTTEEEVANHRHPWLRITPYSPKRVGANSYDVSIGREVAFYRGSPFETLDFTGADQQSRLVPPRVLDPRSLPPLDTIQIPEAGLQLQPGRLYLGATVEHFRTRDCIPHIDGRSSVGRFGVSVHVTAGKGDAGFCGTLTMELWCLEPVLIFPNMRIAQVTFERLDVLPGVGISRVDAGVTVTAEYRGRYLDQREPTASRFALPDPVAGPV